MSRECMLLGSLSRHNKDLERRTLKPLVRHSSWVLTNCVIALRQISVTALFYLEDRRRIHPRSVRACQPKDAKRREWRSMPAGAGVEVGAVVERDRERERKHLGSSFYVFFLPLDLPYANWA